MTLTTFMSLIAQAQQAPPTPPSPDILKALTELMNAVAGHTVQRDAGSWWTPAGLTSIAALINAIAWPALAGLVVYKFSPQFVSFLTRVNKLEIFGLKAEIQNELNKSAEEAASSEGRSKAPRQDELERAVKVEEIAKQADLSLIRQQVAALATEYESVRASMPPSDARTRRMEVVVSKMRTIGRAAYPLRYELIQSPSPGHRLQAIASLQTMSDFEQLDWLAQRLRDEKPFIAYHAVVALNVAARDPQAPHHIEALEAALQKAKDNTTGLRPDTDRSEGLKQLEQQIAKLKG